MPDLVALDIPAGPDFVGLLADAWEAGDAVFPVDRRLPQAGRAALLDVIKPTRIVTTEGETRLDGVPAAAGDALVVATSGTHGAPRGVVLTHDAVGAAALATTKRLAIDPDLHRWLACLPLSHMGGLGVVTRALLTSTAVEVHDGFDASRVEDAAQSGATHVSLVATLLGRIDPSRFECILVGGGPTPGPIPSNVTITYGLTETCGGVVYDGVPLDGVELRIVGGEIQVRGPTLLRAYRDGSDPCDVDGWLPTGDIGRFGSDGRLVVEGRRRDLIISGGENIWPHPVEQRLSLHPSIAAVAVVGRADPEWGQIVVAVIVPAAGVDPPDLSAVRAFVKETMPAFMAPRVVEYVEHLPRTSLGKVRRDLLG